MLSRLCVAFTLLGVGTSLAHVVESPAHTNGVTLPFQSKETQTRDSGFTLQATSQVDFELEIRSKSTPLPAPIFPFPVKMPAPKPAAKKAPFPTKPFFIITGSLIAVSFLIPAAIFNGYADGAYLDYMNQTQKHAIAN